MKYTNIKKLLIKFMGGGLINFPTRFLRWVKIDGDLEGDDSGGGSDSDNDVFFVPATIQPKYFLNNDGTEVIEIKNYTSDVEYATFLYNKEDIISLGVNEEALNSLAQVTIEEAFDDINSQHPTKGLNIDKNVFKNTIILEYISKGNGITEPSQVDTYSFKINEMYNIYKISNNIFLILNYIPSIN